ncbi:MAG: hypothetical protein HY372_01035 [Candidatus Andersenbacteria bacterium]|nr:hypothetical protein [Candidatus Andersenbacteria bacterium]
MSVPDTKPFDSWYIPDPPRVIDDPSSERFVYVGCVHETTNNIVERLSALVSNPPDYLIFGGDVTGSHELETFKRLFYNLVYNRARGEIGIGTEHEANITDTELLAYVGRTPPCPGHTLQDGYEDLMRYQYTLQGSPAEEAQQQLSASEIAHGIRHIARDFTYYGPWVKTLSRPVREAVVRTMQTDAEKLLAAIQPLQQRDIKVIMLGGNWDNAQNTRDNMVGEDIEVFDTIPFFRQHGIEFFDAISCISTDKTVHIFIPYWELARGFSHDESTVTRLNNAMAQVIYGCREGKTIIVVAHAEPNWQAHNVSSAAEPTGDRQITIKALGACLALLQPDEIIYPHQHNLLRDADNIELPANTKYLIRPASNGVQLVCDKSQFSHTRNIIATYVPYQRLAALTAPRTGNPRPKLFGGTREPAHVT